MIECVSSSELSDMTVTVLECLGHLKCNKSGGSVMTSDFFIHSAPVIADWLASFFTSVLRHGYMPACMHP